MINYDTVDIFCDVCSYVIFFSPPKDRCYKCGRDCSKKVGYAPGAHCDNCNKIFE